MDWLDTNWGQRGMGCNPLKKYEMFKTKDGHVDHMCQSQDCLWYYQAPKTMFVTLSVINRKGGEASYFFFS